MTLKFYQFVIALARPTILTCTGSVAKSTTLNKCAANLATWPVKFKDEKIVTIVRLRSVFAFHLLASRTYDARIGRNAYEFIMTTDVL